jgi:hypothetical protein
MSARKIQCCIVVAVSHSNRRATDLHFVPAFFTSKREHVVSLFLPAELSRAEELDPIRLLLFGALLWAVGTFVTLRCCAFGSGKSSSSKTGSGGLMVLMVSTVYKTVGGNSVQYCTERRSRACYTPAPFLWP